MKNLYLRKNKLKKKMIKYMHMNKIEKKIQKIKQ